MLLASNAAGAASFDINGVALGGAEVDVNKAFPSARCKALEWKSDAADRRCDDGKIVVAGVVAKITVYLKRDAIQAFDLRFDVKDLARVTGHFKNRWGKPATEAPRQDLQGWQGIARGVQGGMAAGEGPCGAHLGLDRQPRIVERFARQFRGRDLPGQMSG